MDTVPEIMDGKNVADFIDPDIVEKLEALEREEEKLQAEGFYENDEIIVSTITDFSSDINLNNSPFSLTRMMNGKRWKHDQHSRTKLHRRASRSRRRINLAYLAQLVCELSLS